MTLCRIILGIVAVLLVLQAAPLLASSGYRTDFDFPGHGDDWYGRSMPDIRRDFPANPVDQASDGYDFGRGVEIMVASSGYGPPLASTQAPHHEYRFRYGDRLSDPRDCYVDTNCADGVFCNGTEVCLSNTCNPGSLPSCDDAEPCTTDYCDTGPDACAHDPLLDPGEIQNLILTKVPATAIASLSWADQSAADQYNVYRGEQTDLSDLTCYAIVNTNSMDDEGDLPAENLFEYLVSSVGCGSESTLGESKDGEERLPLIGCP